LFIELNNGCKNSKKVEPNKSISGKKVKPNKDVSGKKIKPEEF